MNEKRVISDVEQEIIQFDQHFNQQIFNDRTPHSTTHTAAKNDSDDHSNRSFDVSELERCKAASVEYERQIASCRETIHLLEEQYKILIAKEQRRKDVEWADHRFIHQLFHLCATHSPESEALKPSHRHMKTFIRQTFDHLLLQQVKFDYEKEHSCCFLKEERTADKIHRPSYEFCLKILDQYQNLFGIESFDQIPSSLMKLYYQHGELKNFLHAISSLLQIDTENPELLIAPLAKVVEQSKTDEMIAFRKINVKQALPKIQSHEHLLPSYYRFIEQLANLLEVSKGDQIIPAIKTLQLLAHSDMYSR